MSAATSRRLLLRVSCRRFVAGAVWERTADGWRCIRAAPIIAWLKGCSARTASVRLDREKLAYEWIDL